MECEGIITSVGAPIVPGHSAGSGGEHLAEEQEAGGGAVPSSRNRSSLQCASREAVKERHRRMMLRGRLLAFSLGG